MVDNVRIIFNDAEIHGLKRDPAIRLDMLDNGQDVAAEAARRAPKRTGHGASTIHAESVDEIGEVTVRVSWDRSAYYLFYQHEGTRYLPANPFLTEALDRYARF